MTQFTIHHILSLMGLEYLKPGISMPHMIFSMLELCMQERTINTNLLMYLYGSKRTDQNSSELDEILDLCSPSTFYTLLTIRLVRAH